MKKMYESAIAPAKLPRMIPVALPAPISSRSGMPYPAEMTVPMRQHRRRTPSHLPRGEGALTDEEGQDAAGEAEVEGNEP